jgi:hypothetical protein
MKTDYERERKEILMSYLQKKLTHGGKFCINEVLQNLGSDEDNQPEQIRQEFHMLQFQQST